MAAVIVIVIVVVLGLLLVLLYNGLVKRRNRTQEAWSQIDVELKRRHDLIPNLVETVKGYAAHESGTFQAVTQARANAVSATASGDPAAVGAAENQLTGALRQLMVVAEAYPQLRAVEQFNQLSEQLTATEDKIEFARRYYNGSARDYNTALQTFPRNLIAGIGHFTPVGFFEADATDREVPQVSFGATPGAPGGPPAPGAGAPPAPGAGGPPSAQ
ncbi:MAG TPA: LemA family protein [Mycobacteriales bacterium]|nr:LemA family protein [Mycobacteriales bacterium]